MLGFQGALSIPLVMDFEAPPAKAPVLNRAAGSGSVRLHWSICTVPGRKSVALAQALGTKAKARRLPVRAVPARLAFCRTPSC
jgi:hypothetical protein